MNDNGIVSVIIPLHNAAGPIVDLLLALLRQTRTPDEILVVDDGSTDGSRQVVRDWMAEHPELNIILIRQKNLGPAAARNRGTVESQGDFLVFVDSDCLPLPDWLEKMVKAFDDPQVVGVQGAYRCDQPELIAQFCQLEIEDRYNRMKQAEHIDFIGTYAAAYRRTVFFQQGSFDTRYPMASGEDADFSFRLASRGYCMVFRPEAVVCHRHPTSLPAYLRQKYWRAYWRNLIYRHHFSKMWKDSYTPQTLKLQTVLGILFPLSTIGWLVGGWWAWVPLVVLIGILVLCMPFTLWTMRRSLMIGLVTPLLLFLRTIVFALGTIHGVAKGLWMRVDLR